LRTRLLGLVLSLMAVVLLALGVPLGMDLASVQTQRVFLDRLNDANRFVQVAQQQGDITVLADKLARYDEVYGIAVAVIDRSGHIRAASRPGLGTQTRTPAIGHLAAVALSGQHGEPPRAIWPWEAAPLVVAQPVINGGDVVGAVVTMSPTAGLRRGIARAWLEVGLGELIALLGCALLASRLTRWILRPVHDLDTAAHAIATGRMATRAALNGNGPPELQRLTASFNHMAANVEQLVQRQRNFLADASHQLRNPLHALLLRLDTLALTTPEDPAVDAASKEGRHLAGILERLLALAQAEEETPAHEPIDLAALADERAGAWEAVAESKAITLRRTGPARAHTHADPIAVASALDVIVDNAIKFAPERSTVTIAVAPTAITVSDEGPGMDPRALARAGDRFWRAREHQNVDGSGLGLAIARTLLERGGGELTLEPNHPHGLRATLSGLGVAEPARSGRVQRHRRRFDRRPPVERGGGHDAPRDRGAALE
jgi:signal transduction histidine kinase